MGRRHLRRLERFVLELTEDWEWGARCIGQSDLFFPERGQSRRVEQAKKICSECPVLSQCHDKAQDDPPEYGVWAGKLYQPRKNKPDE